ncbi:GNAT family N-acetyltransferase [candidate division KSB1 bacterium]|nr:GNAT family N-acetyltransferase [candidate division KSB1 bacterium]
MSDSYKTEEFKCVLEKIPPVKSVGTIEIVENFIKYISIETKSMGSVAIHRLDVKYSAALFDFYFKGLSEESRKRFYPYPLFDTPPESAKELSRRIKDWQREDDWTVLNLTKGQRIIGICLLKRFRTPQATSGLAVHEEYRRKGLGHLLQTIVNEQARFLQLKSFHVKVEPENIASLRLHEKCGFKQTRTVPYLGYRDGVRKEIPVIEMVLELSYE